MSKKEEKKDTTKKATPVAKKEEPKAVASAPAKKAAPVVKPKKEEPKAQPTKEEKAPDKNPQEKSEFVAVPDACNAVVFKKGIYGAYNPDDTYCKECETDFPETAKACKHNTEIMKKTTSAKKTAQKATTAAAKKTGGTKKSSGNKERDCFGRLVDSGAGRIDAMLLRKEGATMEEMEKERKAVSSHLANLKSQGFEVTFKDGKYFAKAPKK